jgi:hypothetical protein
MKSCAKRSPFFTDLQSGDMSGQLTAGRKEPSTCDEPHAMSYEPTRTLWFRLVGIGHVNFKTVNAAVTGGLQKGGSDG